MPDLQYNGYRQLLANLKLESKQGKKITRKKIEELMEILKKNKVYPQFLELRFIDALSNSKIRKRIHKSLQKKLKGYEYFFSLSITDGETIDRPLLRQKFNKAKRTVNLSMKISSNATDKQIATVRSYAKCNDTEEFIAIVGVCLSEYRLLKKLRSRLPSHQKQRITSIETGNSHKVRETFRYFERMENW